MKSTLLICTVITMTLSSFTTDRVSDRAGASTQFAQTIITAIQQESSDEYTRSLATLDDFHKLMETNSVLYGSNLDEAKREFDSQYVSEVLPDAKNSFITLLAEGKAHGIQWKKIHLVKTQLLNEKSITNIEMVISSEGKEFMIRIKNVLWLDNEWKSTQHIELI